MYFWELEGIKEGRKIKVNHWVSEDYIYWDKKQRKWINREDKETSSPFYYFDNDNWRYYAEPKAKKKIKLYRYTVEYFYDNEICQGNWTTDEYTFDEGEKLLMTEEKEIEIDL